MTPKPFPFPSGFRFGVATSGFQIEGGYNGPGEPRNNWFGWEATGRVERSGIALDFWSRYPAILDRAAALGCDAFRMSVEWTRCEPEQGKLDAAAFDRYAAILEACRLRGMEPVAALYHFTHPMWLGVDFWLRPEAPRLFAGWARTVVERLGGRCRHWITLNEPNIFALCAYLLGVFPPGRRLAFGNLRRALDHLMAAHILAYGEIHSLQPGAVVGTNNFAYSAYPLDRMLTDLLLARRHRVERHHLQQWLRRRRALFDAAFPPESLWESVLRGLLAALMPLERSLPRAVAAVYAGPHDCTLDLCMVDYYNPFLSNRLRLPGHPTAGGRHWGFTRLIWDDPPSPEGLLRYLRLSREPGLDLWVVENGLCNRVHRGQSHPRADGWDRVRYLRANLGAVVRALEEGIPVAAYHHWTLADNYEWGSYEPRFGLYGVDRVDGAMRWSDLDSMGGDAAGAYVRIIQGLRAGDRSVVE